MTIPEPPREPRWPPCLARRWVCGLIGFILVDLGFGLWVALEITQTAFFSRNLVFGAMVGPGLVLLGIWLRGILRLRVLLREGTLTDAEVLEVKPTLGLNPPHLRLRYRLRDETGQYHETTQYVRTGSILGRRLLERPTTLPVIRDPHEPGFSRAVDPGDFAPTHMTT